jgi:hypothetical protein
MSDEIPGGLPKPESFRCPHCDQHIKDAVVKRYVANQNRAKSYSSGKKRGTSPGRPRSVTDEMIRRVRELRASEDPPMPYAKIADLLGMKMWTVKSICLGEHRYGESDR